MSNDLVLLHQVHPLKLGADVSAVQYHAWARE
jgi:hypothetical protein